MLRLQEYPTLVPALGIVFAVLAVVCAAAAYLIAW